MTSARSFGTATATECATLATTSACASRALRQKATARLRSVVRRTRLATQCPASACALHALLRTVDVPKSKTATVARATQARGSATAQTGTTRPQTALAAWTAKTLTPDANRTHALAMAPARMRTLAFANLTTGSRVRTDGSACRAPRASLACSAPTKKSAISTAFACKECASAIAATTF